MEPVFETHAHYLYQVPLSCSAALFREEMALTGADRIAFLSIPKEYNADGTVKLDLLQNIKGLYLKDALSPNAYCLAGLVHPEDYRDADAAAEDFLAQIRTYHAAGFDGMKMLEGYPTFQKYAKLPLDSPIFDPFYGYAEEHGIPVILHAANPDESWDPNTTDQALIRMGRIYDSSYPSKEEIMAQVFRLLDKHPGLRLTLAHFGFFSQHYDDAVRYMAYPETRLDVTPGGEQFLTMGAAWNIWGPFFETYGDRIIYGTDFYVYPRADEESWRFSVNLRPGFLRQFFETDTEHVYLGTTFRGVKISAALREKIYRKNALALFGAPRTIDRTFFADEYRRLVPLITDEFQKEDLRFLRNTLFPDTASV